MHPAKEHSGLRTEGPRSGCVPAPFARPLAVLPAWLPRGLLTVVVAFLAATPAAPGADVSAMEDLVRQWVSLRREIQQTKSAWSGQESLLREELALLEQQRKELTAAVAALETVAQNAENEAKAAVTDRESVGTRLGELCGPVSAAERRLREMGARIPPFLRAGLAGSLAKLPPGDVPPAPERVADRVQVVLGLYAQIEQLARSINVGKMVLTEPSGRDREMDVLLVGLANGFAVSPDRALAARGRPGPQGWQWDWDPALAVPISDALAVYRKETPAGFVRLPLQLPEAKP